MVLLTSRPLLLQVCADMSGATTRARGLRALTQAMAEHKRLSGLRHGQGEASKGVTVRPAQPSRRWQRAKQKAASENASSYALGIAYLALAGHR